MNISRYAGKLNHVHPRSHLLNSRVGFNERRCIARDVLGLYGSIVVCAKYTVAVSAQGDRLPLVDIAKALRQCITEHPVLSTVVLDSETEQPRLAHVATISLDNHLFVLAPASPGSAKIITASLLRQAQNQPQPRHGSHPPWRLYVQEVENNNTASQLSFNAAFASSHALADGASALHFHGSFLRALQTAHGLSAGEERDLQILNPEPHLPPLDRIAEMPISWSFLLGPLLGEYLPLRLARALGVVTPGEGVWTGAAVRPARPNPPRLLPTALNLRHVNASTLTNAIKACRSHGARLTGLLVVIIARALRTALQHRSHEYRSFVAETAIDLRRCLPSAKSSMANLASSVTDVVNLPEGYSTESLSDEEWQSAQQISRHQGQVASRLADQPVALLSYLSSIRKWTAESAAKPASASFSLSNLGAFDVAQESGIVQARWTIDTMAFCQSAEGTGAPFNLNMVSTIGGMLSLVVSWWPGMLGVADEPEFVEELLSSVEMDLHSAA